MRHKNAHTLVAARLGLAVVFGTTFLELVGVFMLSPLLLLQLKAQGHSTALAGLFAATGWLGVLGVMPWVARLSRRWGRRRTLQLAAALPVVAVGGFMATPSLSVWFALNALAGMAAGLRWVLAEAAVAEWAPPGQRGLWVGAFETMVGATFVLGPALLAVVGTDNAAALTVVLVLTGAAALGSAALPALPSPAEDAQAPLGLRGLWEALRAHPVVMAAGLVGGFFESGLSSVLPLVGWSMGLPPAQAALLVSASGLGSALVMVPMGWLADRMAAHPQARWGNLGESRQRLMRACAAATLLTSLSLPLVQWWADWIWVAVWIWGGVGGSLYTLAMVDIGDRARGLALVNSTAVLVMAYTLGGSLAPSLGGWALQAGQQTGFTLLLVGAASLGVWALRLKNKS